MRKEYYLAHKEEIKKKNREYYIETRDKRLEYARKYKKDNLQLIKERRIRRKKDEQDYAYRKNYGITIKDYQRMLEEQKFVCAICKKDNGIYKLAVDHCHKTGKVRGLLCKNCNLGLGYFKDDIWLLFDTIKYIKSNK